MELQDAYADPLCAQVLCANVRCPCLLNFGLSRGSADPSGVYDLRYFQALRDFAASHSHHNVVLKWCRHVHESMEAFVFPEWINVPEITHYHGPDYVFEEGAATWPWSWTQLIAGLTEKSMEIVVKGPDGRSRGVVRCEFAPRRNSYDDLTSRALAKAGTPPPNLLRIWDFKIVRDDGSAIHLHPRWKKTKVETFSAEGFDSQVPTPPKGYGKSSGRGSCQANIRMNTQGTLWFDPNKKPRMSSPPKAAVAATATCNALETGRPERQLTHKTTEVDTESESPSAPPAQPPLPPRPPPSLPQELGKIPRRVCNRPQAGESAAGSPAVAAGEAAAVAAGESDDEQGSVHGSA